jgi:hypothetical protein
LPSSLPENSPFETINLSVTEELILISSDEKISIEFLLNYLIFIFPNAKKLMFLDLNG